MRRKLNKFIVGSWEFVDCKPQTTSHEPCTCGVNPVRNLLLTRLEILISNGVKQSLTERVRIWNKKRRFPERHGEGFPFCKKSQNGAPTDVRQRHRSFLTGLTLTEVIVASALLIIAIVPILKALTNAHLNTTIVERRTRSLTLAQAKLDEIKARSIYSYTDTFTETNSSLDGSYLCNVTDESAGSNLRKITVSVGRDHDGDSALANDEIAVTLATYMARRWTD